MPTPDPPNPAVTTTQRPEAGAKADAGLRVLAIDIGGSHVKANVLDGAGDLLGQRVRVVTPVGHPPDDIVGAIVDLIAPLPPYDRVSVGFPGVVRAGVVFTAPNLGHDGWQRFDLAGSLSKRLGKPTRVLNDADMQGLGAIRGRGFEMVITLGTGFGTGLYLDGRLLPHLEIAHQPFRKNETYDEQLGNAARKRIGDKKWSKRVRKAVENLRALTNFDHLYVGGGNAKHVDWDPAPDVTIIDNEAAIEGGVRAWRD